MPGAFLLLLFCYAAHLLLWALRVGGLTGAGFIAGG
jgi:hypothetical protein